MKQLKNSRLEIRFDRKQLYQWFLSATRSIMTALPYLSGMGETRREVTEQYPDPVSSKTEDDLPPKTRGMLYNEIDQCTGCGDCEVLCPTACISVSVEPGPDENKKWVAVFDIDFSKCIFCGICTESCPTGSITHTRNYEGAVIAKEDLLVSFGRGHLTPEQREKWSRMRRFQDSEPSDT